MPTPIQKPGRSKQDYGTPPELLKPIKTRLHIADFDIDVAASNENKVCHYYYDEATNGLHNPWTVPEPESGWAWCNPPFERIVLWVTKATIEAKHGNSTCMLIPASVGSYWWKTRVDPYAYALFLNGRITFVGCEDPYPKDCALLLYTPYRATGNQIWSWE